MPKKVEVPEYKIRTAIKAYLDAGGDSDFFIISKKDVNNHYRQVLEGVLAEGYDEVSQTHNPDAIYNYIVDELGYSPEVEKNERRSSKEDKR